MKGLQIESEQLRFGIIGAMERKLLCQITASTDQKWVAEDKKTPYVEFVRTKG